MSSPAYTEWAHFAAGAGRRAWSEAASGNDVWAEVHAAAYREAEAKGAEALRVRWDRGCFPGCAGCLRVFRVYVRLAHDGSL